MAAVLVLAGAAAGVRADIATLNGGLGYGGGAFTAVIQREAGSPFGVGPNISVKTFCIESESFFQPGTPYYVQYSGSASPGGGGASGGFDPISTATAWLFYQTVTGALNWNIGSGNTAFNFNNQSHNKAVQSAIWVLEGEAQPFSLTSTEQQIRANILSQANFAASLHPGGANFGVQVMRLWSSRNGSAGNYQFSGDRQDQLVLIPLPPAAWAGMSMMAGVLGLAYLRRRKNHTA